MVSSLDNIRFASSPSNYSSNLNKMKENAMITAWAEIYISAVEQSKDDNVNINREQNEMLNLIESELKDLKNLWSGILNSSNVSDLSIECILNASAILTNNMD